MKTLLTRCTLAITLIGSMPLCYGSDDDAIAALGSTKSQAALLIYAFLKLTKKGVSIQDVDDVYYDFFRTTEQGALHYGISTAITDSLAGTSSQANLKDATIDGAGYIATSHLVRGLYSSFLDTSLGASFQNMLTTLLVPAGSEDLCKEATIGVLSTIVYNVIKKWIPSLVPA